MWYKLCLFPSLCVKCMFYLSLCQVYLCTLACAKWFFVYLGLCQVFFCVPLLKPRVCLCTPVSVYLCTLACAKCVVDTRSGAGRLCARGIPRPVKLILTSLYLLETTDALLLKVTWCVDKWAIGWSWKAIKSYKLDLLILSICINTNTTRFSNICEKKIWQKS